MNCQIATDNFTAYLDGEVNPEEHILFTEHLRSCKECAGTFKSFSAIYNVVNDSFDELELSPRIWTRVENAITSSSQRQSITGWFAGWLRVPRFGYAAAAFALLLSVLLFTMRSGDQEPVVSHDLKAELSQVVQEVEGEIRSFQDVSFGSDDRYWNPFFADATLRTDNPFRESGVVRVRPAARDGRPTIKF